MNLKDFIRDKNMKREAGAFAVIVTEEVPPDKIIFIGEGKFSAKMTVPEGEWNYLETAEAIAETMEFMQRKYRTTIGGIAVCSLNQDKLVDALNAFAAEDPLLELPKTWEDDEL